MQDFIPRKFSIKQNADDSIGPISYGLQYYVSGLHLKPNRSFPSERL